MVRDHRGFTEVIFGGRRGLEATASSMCRVYSQGVVYSLVLQYRGHRGFTKLKFIRNGKKSQGFIFRKSGHAVRSHGPPQRPEAVQRSYSVTVEASRP